MPAPTDRTYTESPGSSTPLLPPEPHLLVVLECDRPGSGASRHSLRGIREVSIGRGPDRTAVREGDRLTLTLPSGWISTNHARMCLDQDRWRLEDAGSRNGTRVNGRSIAHLVLADGDIVEVGRALLLFRQALHAPPDSPLDLDVRDPPPIRGLGTLVPALAAEIDALGRIAASSIAVLLRGETGTGKEITARAVHALSGRKGAFVPVNCGAIPPALVESHLFGHARGAFSGAVRDELGFVRAANGGTLFLDEVGDLPPASEAALLRVLQEGEVVPVGTTRGVAVDLRIVAATHQPLEALVARGAFRADLLARLDGFTFSLPPLKERREDIGLLVAALLRELQPTTDGVELSIEVGRALLRYDWPLNIRELGHCLTRACTLAVGHPLELRHLPPPVRATLEAVAECEAPAALSGEERLRAQLEGLLVQHEGNVAEVSRVLGKARMQVHRWLKRFAIDPARYRP